MKAVTQNRYGPASVLTFADLPRPRAAPTGLVCEIHAAAVTTGDWRLRASAFPGSLWLPGRLATGLTRPRHAVPGTAFSGVVAETGVEVTRFAPGDRIFGFVPHGAHAEYLALDGTAAIARMPDGLDFAGAAALPFGAVSALVFLRDVARLATGQRLLVIGATGGVGAYAVQIGAASGAEVTGVASAEHHALGRDLGARAMIDYKTADPLDGRVHYDVILDTVGAAGFRRARAALRPGGVFVPLNFGLGDVLSALVSRFAGDRRMRVTVSGESAEDMARIAAMVEAGRLRPVIDSVHPFDRIAAAHERVESRHSAGAVILQIAADTQHQDRRDAGTDGAVREPA